MNSMALDFKAAFRSCRRNPTFAVAVIVTLALGMAPTCTIFAIMDSVYFRPLPYPGQERLVLLNLSSGGSLEGVDAFTFSEWQKRVGGVESMAAYRNAAFTLNDGDRPERVTGQLVAVDFFKTIRMAPVLGRDLRREDGQPGAPPVLVISNRTWKDYFSGRKDIVGLSVRVDGVPATVVGVLPPAFASFMEGRAAKVWAPLLQSAATAPRQVAAGNVIARVEPSATLQRVQQEVESVHGVLAREFPGFYRGKRALVRDFRASLFGGLGPAIRLLSVMVGLLLLIACGNAANLLLARAVRRTREVALRTALGAHRLRLVRESVVESLLLAFCGATLGLALTYAGTRLLWSMTAPIFQVIGVDAIAFDRRVVIFSVLMTAVATVLFSALPTLRGTRCDVADALRQGPPGTGRAGRRRRMSRALVVVQVTLCVVTMIGTVLVVRGFLHYSRVSADPGFPAKGLVMASLPSPGALASGGAPRHALLAEVARRVAAIPGVERVALTSAVPFLEGGGRTAVTRQGGNDEEPSRRVEADVRAVNADFFDTMSVRLMKGRTFTAADATDSLPVVVIGDRLAQLHWEGAEPLGDRLLIDGVWRVVVGVVRSSGQASPFQRPAPEAFVPYAQASPGALKLLVRSAQPLAPLAPAIRAAVRAVDRDQAVADLSTMEEALDRFMTPFRLVLVLMALFGGTALALAGVGLYGVIAHDVSRRTREIGVRIALGARRDEVVKMVVRDGVQLSAAGLVPGLLLGAGLAKILPSEIFGATGLSAIHYAATASVWLAIAVAASLVPARRASLVEPIATLRVE